MFASASMSASSFPLSQWLTQRMGLGPILCVRINVTIHSIQILTQSQKQTLRVNRALQVPPNILIIFNDFDLIVYSFLSLSNTLIHCIVCGVDFIQSFDYLRQPCFFLRKLPDMLLQLSFQSSFCVLKII